jgi:hypothetical protein
LTQQITSPERLAKKIKHPYTSLPSHQITSPERLANFMFTEMEKTSSIRYLSTSMTQGEIIENSFTILDLKGLSWWKLMDSGIRNFVVYKLRSKSWIF